MTAKELKAEIDRLATEEQTHQTRAVVHRDGYETALVSIGMVRQALAGLRQAHTQALAAEAVPVHATPTDEDRQATDLALVEKVKTRRARSA